MKPINYLLVGFPYAGKTTLAKELEKRLGFARVNIDELKFGKGYTTVGDDDVPDEVWNEIFTDADRLLIEYLKSGKSVANEYAWISREWRDQTKKVAKDAGFETKIIYVTTPKEVILQRWEENSASKERFQFPLQEVEQTLRDFEELGSGEVFIPYNNEDVGEWIKKYLLL